MRKVRSDKKREVKPTLANNLKENLCHYSYVTNQPIKDACLFLIEKGLRNDSILREFQKIMIGDFQTENKLYIGNRKGGFPVKLKWSSKNERVTIKIPQLVYSELNRLSFAVGLSVSATSALMLKAVISSWSFKDEHLMFYMNRLDTKRYLMLERFLIDMLEINPINEKNLPF